MIMELKSCGYWSSDPIIIIIIIIIIHCVDGGDGDVFCIYRNGDIVICYL